MSRGKRKLFWIVPAGNSGNSAFYLHRRRNCDAPVELAAADVVRLASDYLLAGRWNSGAVPDTFWRPWFSRFGRSDVRRRMQERMEERYATHDS